MKSIYTKLLLVEDVPVLVNHIQGCLTELSPFNFKTVWSTSIENATVQLSKSYFDVVLLDISLTDSQGLAGFKMLQQLAPRSLFLLLCAKEHEAMVHQAINMGACDYLNRTDVKKRDLTQMLGRCLNRRAIDNALRVSIAGLEAIGEASPLGVMISDLSGYVTYTNRAYHQITGFSADQLLGQYWADIVYADDRLRIQREWRKALQIQIPFTTQVRILRKDQCVRLVRISGAFLHDRRDLFGHVRMLEDITALETGGQSGISSEHHQNLLLET